MLHNEDSQHTLRTNDHVHTRIGKEKAWGYLGNLGDGWDPCGEAEALRL